MSDSQNMMNLNEKFDHDIYNNKERIYIDSKGKDNNEMILRKNPEMKNEWQSNNIELNTLYKLRNFGCNCGCHGTSNCNDGNENILNNQLNFKYITDRNSPNEQNLLHSQSILLNKDIPNSTSDNRNINDIKIPKIKNMKKLLKKGLPYPLNNGRNLQNEKSNKRLDLNMISGQNYNTYHNTNNNNSNNNFQEFRDEKDGPLSMKSTMKSTGLIRNPKDIDDKSNIDFNAYNNPQIEIKANNLRNNVNSPEINNNIYYYDYHKDFDYYNNKTSYGNSNNNNNRNEEMTGCMSRNTNMNSDIFSFKNSNQNYDLNNNCYQRIENPIKNEKNSSILEQNVKSNNYTYRNYEEKINKKNSNFSAIIGNPNNLNEYVPDNIYYKDNFNSERGNNSMNFMSPTKNRSPYISGNTSFNEKNSTLHIKRNKSLLPNNIQRLGISLNDKKETKQYEKDFKNSDFEIKQKKIKGIKNNRDLGRIIDRIKHFRKIRYKKNNLFRNNDDNFYSGYNIIKNKNSNNIKYSIPQHYHSLCSIKKYINKGKNYSMFNQRDYRDYNNGLNNSLQNCKFFINQSSILPPNPYETVIKARESTFFND